LLFGKNDLLVSLDLQRFTKLDNLWRVRAAKPGDDNGRGWFGT
jgi:hypothetical protein